MSRWDDDLFQEILGAFLVGLLISVIIVLLIAPVYRRLVRFGWKALIPTAALAYLLGTAPAVILHLSIGVSYYQLDNPGMTADWSDVWIWLQNGLSGTAGIMLGFGAAVAVSVYWIRAGQVDQNTAR